MILQGVRQDNTWLVVDPIVGCAHNCQYCFLQIYSKTRQSGQIILSPEQAIEKLLSYWAFKKSSMVMIGSETDIFMNSKNINYLTEFIKLYEANNIKNPLSLSTKCYIPDSFIEFTSTLKSTNLVFYISYSGLPQSIEPYINPEKVKTNFKRLKLANHKVIHFLRPMLPQNSSIDSLRKVLSDVEGADCSIMRGLNLNNKLQQKVWFWEEARNSIIDFSKIVSIWPDDLFSNLKLVLNERDKTQPIFFKNSCALSYVLHKPDFAGIYNTNRCKQSKCPDKQRDLCKFDFYNREWPTTAEIERELQVFNLNNQFKIKDDDKVIEIKGTMNHEQIASLTQILRSRLNVEEIASEHEWGGYVLGHVDKEMTNK